MQNKLRIGRRAWDPTPPLLYEFLEQPRALQIYGGARHGYARSRRLIISKLIKAVMSTFPATLLRARVYGFTIQPDSGSAGEGAGGVLTPTLLFLSSSAPPLFPSLSRHHTPPFSSL